MLNETLRREIEALIPMTDDELYARIGEDLAPERGLLPGEWDERLRQGREWVVGKMGEFKASVCSSDEIHALVIDPGKGVRVELVAAVADLIAHHCIGVGPLSVALVLVRYGIHRMCGWPKSE